MTITTPEGKEYTVEFERRDCVHEACGESVPSVVTWCEIADAERVLARACAVKDSRCRDGEAKGRLVAFGKALPIAAFYAGFDSREARREVWRKVIEEVGLPKPRRTQWSKADRAVFDHETKAESQLDELRRAMEGRYDPPPVQTQRYRNPDWVCMLPRTGPAPACAMSYNDITSRLVWNGHDYHPCIGCPFRAVCTTHGYVMPEVLARKAVAEVVAVTESMIETFEDPALKDAVIDLDRILDEGRKRREEERISASDPDGFDLSLMNSKISHIPPELLRKINDVAERMPMTLEQRQSHLRRCLSRPSKTPALIADRCPPPIGGFHDCSRDSRPRPCPDPV